MKNLYFYIILLVTATLSAQEQFSVYFDSNKHELKKSEQNRLEAWIAANKTSKVLAINGYTDEDGTVGLNDTLAQRRVSYVYATLKGRVKTREDFKARSFGELHQHSKNKAENRKATIFYLPEKDLHRENEILGIKPEPEVVTYPSRIVLTNPNGTKQEIILDPVFMKQVGQAKPGEKLRLKNLNFYENTFNIIPESRPVLYELLEVMRLHKKLKIKLLGHICCMKSDPRKLSYDRAKAVMRFLTLNGIEKSRLTFEGLGTTQPINPIPEKNEEERAENRRVEVLVLEN
ncbi:cell envelope biogenesis protein OmpA [Flavobacterium cyanobacteriorum]|uniref:Cell envelope biogenesis protein OmpA n=1 Tax=Flavobacterium cyanobacteriorum TaxID=2022802 RepID=A0A255YSL9_9FLAO|nr:OmpA family protein [Flavobacterium cyanobacteriorum]OYQ32236.1 cell envelope biogenesis protein OmpA [Flavobacterium cyanobacteriorum]